MVLDYLKHMDLARDLENKIKQKIVGRIATDNDNSLVMACFAGIYGDHLEIGSLHGGSAILVALLKQELGLPGQVVCIDPLDGYYTGTKFSSDRDPITKIPVCREVIDENVRIFGLEGRIEIIQKKSDPFPIKNRRFTSSYIDGNHWGDYPQLDWENVKEVTDKLVIFDNCDKGHPSVLDACQIAAFSDNWFPCHRQGIVSVFERF